ncbi:MAG: TolC family protein [Hyphomicrobium sp.]
MEQAIQEALAKNLDLAAQKYDITVAEARLITAKLRPNPVLTVSGQTLNVFGAAYNPNTPLGPNQMNIHTDVPIERGHKREERMALAEQDRTLAELGVRETMRQVIYNVQSAFVDVQLAKETLALAQDNLRSLEGVVGVNETRRRTGDLAQVELDRSRVAALQYRTAVTQAQLQLDQAKTQLQLLMGRTQRSAAFDVAGTLRADLLTDTREEVARQALARRPDYLATQQTEARSRTDLLLQLANGKSDFVVGTEFTRQDGVGHFGQFAGRVLQHAAEDFQSQPG